MPICSVVSLFQICNDSSGLLRWFGNFFALYIGIAGISSFDSWTIPKAEQITVESYARKKKRGKLDERDCSQRIMFEGQKINDDGGEYINHRLIFYVTGVLANQVLILLRPPNKQLVSWWIRTAAGPRYDRYGPV